MSAHSNIAGPIHGPYAAPRRSVRAIAADVSDKTGIPLALILDHSRRAEIVRARWLVWAIARGQGFSLPQIARATGHNHTSVLHALRRMEAARAALKAADMTDRIGRAAA